MSSRRIAIAIAVAVLNLASAAAGATEPPPPTAAELTQALRNFLSLRGDICLAKYDWPRDVSARDVAASTRDAVQLPVLERLGVVESENGYVVYRSGDVEEKVPTRRYRLTAQGLRSYKGRETSSRPSGGPPVAHHGDLCAGRIELSELVKVSVSAAPGGGPGTARVSYRYRFTPEPWVDNEAIRRVFPMLDQLLKGQGRMEMTQSFHSDGGAWVADAAID